jgi:DNA-binding NarL/FixJ family response regulator
MNPAPSPSPRRTRALPDQIGSTRRVVVITDRSIHAAALESILDGEPDFAVVGKATTYAVAVHRARDLQPDLLLVDLAMAGLNEPLLLHGLRMACPDSTLVVINGTGSAQDEAQALEEGADLYCEARIGVTNLVGMLREAQPWGTPDLRLPEAGTERHNAHGGRSLA